MTDFLTQAKFYTDPEMMAQGYLRMYFADSLPSYPLNPFQMLKDAGIIFSFRNFKKLEGVYIPASNTSDQAIVGINCNRPITRQRYSAVHELCHHYRDAEKEIACPFGSKTPIEKFADNFAAAVLMPKKELTKQVQLRAVHGFVSFPDVLEIADYFGVSFDACAYRIAYKLHMLEGDTSQPALKKRINKFAPDKRRKSLGLTYANLYADLIDSYADTLAFKPSEHARRLFSTNYIYNDNRMEDVDVTLEQAAEIVTDLRLNQQHSQYCNEENEAYMSVAGHYEMYQYIFSEEPQSSCSVFNTCTLNHQLFSYYPHPEYGGSYRKNDTVVLGAKFETVTHSQIVPELLKLEGELKELISKKDQMRTSEYIQGIFRIHHRLTVIHPFADGNGRTLRAFMNLMLVRNHISPLYIKVEDKETYIQALSHTDLTGDYSELYEELFKVLLRSNMELTESEP